MNNKLLQSLGIVAVVGLIVVAILYLDSTKPKFNTEAIELVEVMEDNIDKASMYETAKEITTPDGFINIDSIKLEDYIGKKVILVDFWTYSCINCQRTFPYLNDWYKKYEDEGLIIVGVHTPEFGFEKKYENVVKAVEKFGIKFPVVLDNDFSTWKAYQNTFWPRKYLIDIDGFIVYDHIGEGAYDETEAKIVELLQERADKLGMNKTIEIKESNVIAERPNHSQSITRETYIGSARLASLGNNQTEASVCQVGTDCTFTFPENLGENLFALDGAWEITPEYSENKEAGAGIRINFRAKKVNLVVDTEKKVRAQVLLDGEPITKTASGDTVIDGYVEFDRAGLYNLVDMEDYSRHILDVIFEEPGVQSFAYTFG